MKAKLGNALAVVVILSVAGIGYVTKLQKLDVDRIAQDNLESCPVQIFPATIDITRFDQITLEHRGLGSNYKITISGDGKVKYDGKNLVKIKGTANSSLSLLQIKKLVSALNSSGYFSIPDYTPRKGCLNEGSPSHDIRTSVTIGGKTHSLDHYVPHSPNKPPQLSEFEKIIEDTANSAKWVGNPEELKKIYEEISIFT